MSQPVQDAVQIPVDQLERRVYELPERSTRLVIPETGPEAAAAVEILCRMGRTAELTPARFGPSSSPAYRLWRPPALLESVASKLPEGRALCLACGTGREAVWLRALGWSVTALDLLPDALDQGRQLEARSGLQGIRWGEADLRKEQLEVEDRYDLVVQFLFWSDHTPSHFRAALLDGGLGVVEVFSRAYREAQKGQIEGRRWNDGDWDGWGVELDQLGPEEKTHQLVVRADFLSP